MNNNTNPLQKDLRSPDHFSYLLRLWRSTGQWQASLENLGTRERLGFADLEQLFTYLMDLIENKFKMQGNTEENEKKEIG
jgi:hypothetical protein